MHPDKSPEERAKRASEAIYLYYAEGLTQQEIAEKLDVSQGSVSNYIRQDPSDAVKEKMSRQAAQTRIMSWEILTKQLQAAHGRADDAMDVSPDWDEGVTVVTIRNEETGQIEDRFPIPVDYKIEPDHEARAEARDEVRSILEDMQTLTGAADTTIELSAAGGDGEETVSISASWIDEVNDGSE